MLKVFYAFIWCVNLTNISWDFFSFLLGCIVFFLLLFIVYYLWGFCLVFCCFGYLYPCYVFLCFFCFSCLFLILVCGFFFCLSSCLWSFPLPSLGDMCGSRFVDCFLLDSWLSVVCVVFVSMICVWIGEKVVTVLPAGVKNVCEAVC